MWKQKIGISLDNDYSAPTVEVVKIVKQVGFDAISPVFESNVNLETLVKCANDCGLVLQSLHAPFGKAADMWSNSEDLSIPAINEIFSAIDACVEFKIPVLVVHTWIGFEYQFDESTLNFNNFDLLVEYAKKKGVKIAFENTEGEEYLFALMKHFETEDTVGFCWDSGHEMCYNHSQDLLSKYGDRLIMTHINDNLGISRFDGKTFWTDDLHLLPFDGIADWDNNVYRLRKSRHLDFLNFELNISSKPDRHENDIYGKMSLDEYFTEAYKRACKIAYLYSK